MNSDNFPRFRLLGALRVTRDGREVDLGGDRDRRMLVVLLAARAEPLSREALMRWIWDEPGPTAEGMHRFSKLVNTARAGDNEHAAELLCQMLDLFEGEPFGVLCGERGDNFRTTLLAERMSARLEYADVSLRLRRETRILPELVELNRTEPCHEKVAGLLMRAHYRNNDPNRAGAVFWHLRKQLDENLGAEVGKELVELNQRMIEQDPALLPVRREKNSGPRGANTADADEPTTQVHTTGARTAFGAKARAAENLVFNSGQHATSTWPGTGARAVHTGDKIAVDGAWAVEHAVFNGDPE